MRDGTGSKFIKARYNRKRGGFISHRIHSGATPDQIKNDRIPLITFQEDGMPLKELEKLVEERLLPHLMNYDLPTFQSMFNTSLEKGAEYGARIALHYNQGVTNWQVSPGGAMLEELCCQAMCSLFNLAPTAGATFMYSGTYANLQALYLALHWKAEQEGCNVASEGLQGFDHQLKVVTSCDAHFSLIHAMRTLGLGDKNIIRVPVDEQRRMDISSVLSILQSSSDDIICVVATAGTTSTGSVDPLEPLAPLCKKHDTWLHVDGAYGLAYSLLPQYRHLFSGMEKAHSISWDPHKQMGVPIPNSVLFLKNEKDFERMAVYSHYFNREGELNPGLKSPPSTRPFSALPLVTSIRYQGLHAVLNRLRAPLKAIQSLYDRLITDELIEVCHAPDLGILCFRMIPPHIPEEDLNDLQRHIYTTIESEGTHSVSMTSLDEKVVLRIVAISPLITVDSLMETIVRIKKIANHYRR
jgi:L-2,4-diaminobutyrate decarboxylase